MTYTGKFKRFLKRSGVPEWLLSGDCADQLELAERLRTVGGAELRLAVVPELRGIPPVTDMAHESVAEAIRCCLRAIGERMTVTTGAVWVLWPSTLRLPAFSDVRNTESKRPRIAGVSRDKVVRPYRHLVTLQDADDTRRDLDTVLRALGLSRVSLSQAGSETWRYDLRGRQVVELHENHAVFKDCTEPVPAMFAFEDGDECAVLLGRHALNYIVFVVKRLLDQQAGLPGDGGTRS